MSEESIVAVFDTVGHAEAAVQALKHAGIPDSAIHVHADGTTSGTVAPVREEGFWASLFGGEPEHDSATYERSIQNGASVVTVMVDEAHAAMVTEILEAHSPVDIDDTAATYGTRTTTIAEPVAPPGAMTTGVAARSADLMEPVGATTDMHGATLRLAEEELSVGKRLVNRGGTRIRRFVVSTPVEKSVSLHEEKVTIERRPVTGTAAVTDADFSEKTIEMTESAEEAVVAKRAFIREEITLRKEESERVETVQDTVRREDVEIEQIPGTATVTKPI